MFKLIKEVYSEVNGRNFLEVKSNKDITYRLLTQTDADYIKEYHDRLADVALKNSKEIKLLEEKLNLILDYLKLQYIPEIDKKIPSKLVTTFIGFGVANKKKTKK